MTRYVFRAFGILSLALFCGTPFRDGLNRASIVILSTDNIGYGGAATNAQDLYEYLKDFYSARFTIHLLFVKTACQDILLHNCIRFRALRNITPRRVHAVFALNYAAPVLAHRIFPNTRLFFVAVGSEVAIRESEASGSTAPTMSSARTCADGGETIAGYHISEVAAARVASAILAVSQDVQAYMKACSAKPVVLFDIVGLRYARLQNTRFQSYPTCDVCFAVSNVNRLVKNAGFVKRLMRQRSSTRFCIAGHGAQDFFRDSVTRKDIILELLDQTALLRFIRDCKIVIVPSLWESSGNVVAETIAAGRLPLTSTTGFYKVLHVLSVIHGFSVMDWLQRIDTLLALPVSQNARIVSANSAAMSKRMRVAKFQLDAIVNEL